MAAAVAQIMPEPAECRFQAIPIHEGGRTPHLSTNSVPFNPISFVVTLLLLHHSLLAMVGEGKDLDGWLQVGAVLHPNRACIKTLQRQLHTATLTLIRTDTTRRAQQQEEEEGSNNH